MQLVAYGAQDIYLTGNPQITFFKVVYRRHTNFSMELIEQTFNGAVASGGRVTSTISRNGDLVHRLYTNYNPSKLGAANSADINLYYPSFRMLKTVELEIGGQKIDKLYDHWLVTQHELFTLNPTNSFPLLDGGKFAVYDAATGGDAAHKKATYNKPTKEQQMSFHGFGAIDSSTSPGENSAWVPLPFWFCRNVGLALPLIALQYHEVKVIIELNNPGDNDFADTGGISNCDLKLWAEYIYLDTDERRRFAQVSHEYLIEQLQYQESTMKQGVDLNFNHPVKEIIFSRKNNNDDSELSITNSDVTDPSNLPQAKNMPSMIQDSNGKYSGTIGLKLNGHERFAPQHLDYFTRTQVYQHHTGSSVVHPDTHGVYSFALKPEEHQPSGTCNFSRIDSAQLTFEPAPPTNQGNLSVYAVNYNVLRIMSGMGGLAYSN